MTPARGVLVGFVVGGLLVGSAVYLVAGTEDEPQRPLSQPTTGDDSTPSPTASEATVASPPPTPSPSVDERFVGLDATDPLRLDGIGGIVVGMSVEEAERVSGLKIRVGDEFTASCRYGHPVGGPQDLAFMLSYGEIVRIDVFNRSTIETLSGIGIGDTKDDVLATYGDRIERQPHPYLGDKGSYLVFHPREDEELLLIFETGREKVIGFRAGLAEQVRYIEGCA